MEKERPARELDLAQFRLWYNGIEMRRGNLLLRSKGRDQYYVVQICQFVLLNFIRFVIRMFRCKMKTLSFLDFRESSY